MINIFKTEFKGRPKPAERPRARFSKSGRFYMFTPNSYKNYQKEVTEFFNKFADEPNFKDLFTPNKLVYGLSVTLIFKMTLKKKSANPFYGMRPDIDNLYKAVVDALFLNQVNMKEVGYQLDEEENVLFDEDGKPLIKYAQRVDDSRVVHTEQLKLRVDYKDEEGFFIKLRNVGKDEFNTFVDNEMR